MTLAEALAKADRQFDPLAAQNLLDAEDMVRDMGGTDAEVAAHVERQRVALERTRAEMHSIIRTAWWAGFDAPSSLVH